MNRTGAGSMIVNHTTLQVDAKSDYGHHWILITKDGEFFKHQEYRGFTNTEMHDECKLLAKTFPANEGYVIDWQ
jgi:hypothetical protein